MSALFSQFVGFTISLVQLGIAFSQGYCYYRTFPHDKWPLKSFVVNLLFAVLPYLPCTLFNYEQDHGYSLDGLVLHHVLVVHLRLFSKRFSNVSVMVSGLTCIQSPNLLLLAVTIPFVVQRYHADVTVMSDAYLGVTQFLLSSCVDNDGNIYITMPIILLVASSYGLGLALIPSQAVGAFASDTTLKLATWGAFLSAMCDCMISMSVYFYLRPSRSGVKW
ncbi:hypothetical protein AZE42_05263 [Rhizopogon vesiculosus]|uniref:Uncharacterized protein n=1 Tax=Rhizopogon vesiculosus TaxID=180088 RepID=A0A1J8QQQ1_9AGAM|nr:hypothetical protein AZE42_05263 [Rhizopogon vesiculosus]